MIEDLGLVIEELSALHRLHWDELGTGGEFNFRYDLLRRMWEQNMVRVLGLFDGNNLVGHATGYILTDMMTGAKTAVEQSVYLLPAYRGKSYGMQLGLRAIEEMRKECITRARMTCALNIPANSLIQKLGFRHVGNVYEYDLNTVSETHATRRTASA
jgi:GNAT superfamily N-acetyltransferase